MLSIFKLVISFQKQVMKLEKIRMKLEKFSKHCKAWHSFHFKIFKVLFKI